jgi:high-affinity iron transporter
MLATAIIVFREVLEAALIVSVVMAGSQGVARRGQWVLAGIGAGIAGSIIVAIFAGAIAAAASGMGQELFNAGVLFAAVVMLAWHCLWMGRHGRDIALQMSEVSRAVAVGSRPLYVLAVVVGLAVVREGAETVLFLYGIAAGGGSLSELAFGGLVGLAGGMGLGFALYFGLLRIPARHLFAATTWLIILVAAGLASQGASYLVQAGILPSLGRAIWDSSWLLSERGLVGQVLHTLIGYDARPSGIQLVFYAATLLLIGLPTWRIGRSLPPPSRPALAE